MKFLVFGTGEYYQRYKKWIAKEEVVALLDNSPAKQHTVVDGKEVLPPQEGVRREFDAVIIMSFYVKAMKCQLLELGVPERKIYHFYDLRKLIDLDKNRQSVQLYGSSEQELKGMAGRSIALLSTDLALGGTAIALFHMEEVLTKLGYSVVFASTMDGPLRGRFEEKGIPLVIDPNLQLATMQETGWLAGFCLVICNAINYYVFLSKRDLRIPVVWWLHDSPFFYDGVDREIMGRISQKNLTVLSVGPISEEAIHKVLPELPVEQLLYGVEDVAGSGDMSIKADKEERSQGKICFVTIGHIEERKGQDILLRAVRLLKKEEREKAVFYLVGQDTSLLAERIKEAAASMPEVVLKGPVSREKIGEILRSADVMVCPSREDPMPTVAAEAMMYELPCILSNAAGTAAYIREGENGFVFSNGDASELAGKIRWCIGNREKLTGLGKRARKIYEERFSMDVFEGNLCRYIKGALSEEIVSKEENDYEGGYMGMR